MFTGLISAQSLILSIENMGQYGKRVTLRTHYSPSRLVVGGSIACDGCCLSAVSLREATLNSREQCLEVDLDVSPETLACTTLKSWQKDRLVNTELALRPLDPIGGHIVTGHIDGQACLEERSHTEGFQTLTFSYPPLLAPYIAQKGSVTLNGVSLTVNELGSNSFSVMLIPHTLQETNLGQMEPKGFVNLEVDILARYTQRILSVQPKDSL